MHKVSIWDDSHEFYTTGQYLVYEWVLENCPSFIKRTWADYSDFDNYGGPADTEYQYFFADEKDATLFALRWVK
jgi:hypothetical protein